MPAIAPVERESDDELLSPAADVDAAPVPVLDDAVVVTAVALEVVALETDVMATWYCEVTVRDTC